MGGDEWRRLRFVLTARRRRKKSFKNCRNIRANDNDIAARSVRTRREDELPFERCGLSSTNR
jgi:hypothetical protein